MKQTNHDDFERWLSSQTKKLPGADVSPEFLAAQRRGIYRRIDQPQRRVHVTRWALSLAMLLMLFAASLTLPRRHAAAPAISDDQLFSDLSAMDQTNEPRAIQPIHGLFQE
jgi:hypothetical protein